MPTIGVPTPRLYAVRRRPLGPAPPAAPAGRAHDFVLKPNRGSAGRGVLVVVGRDGDAFVRHNGERLGLPATSASTSPASSPACSRSAGSPTRCLVQQRVVPDPAFERISYQGTPDIRVILYRSAGDGDAAAADEAVGGRANLHQGASAPAWTWRPGSPRGPCCATA